MIESGIRARLLGALLSLPALALANPTGPVAVSGVQSITGVGTATVTVNQNAAHAIVNWSDFSNDAGELVHFIQPSASAAILNRVTGTSVSQIFGAIQANGRVLLVNPNGIVFGPGAQADMAGLVASTLNITDANFNADHWQFDGVPDGTVPGRVLNDGALTASSGGFVALLGQGGVQNETAITAPKGSILLASGSSIFVDPVGDGLLLYQVTAPTLNHYHYASDSDPNQNDAGNDSVINYGPLTADGGRIAMETFADFVTFSAVYNSGATVRARTAVAGENGQIRLVARGTSVLQDGSLDASGPGNGSVSIISDKAVALRPGTDFGFTNDGNNPPNILAHSFTLDTADFSPQRITIAADSIDLRATRGISLSDVTLKGQNSASPAILTLRAGQIDLSNLTLTTPNLVLISEGLATQANPDAGRLFLGNDDFSGTTLQLTGSNIDVRNSSLDYTQSTGMTASARINLDQTLINSRLQNPGALNLTSAASTVIANSTVHASRLVGHAGASGILFDDGIGFANSTVNAGSMELDANYVFADVFADASVHSTLNVTGALDINIPVAHAEQNGVLLQNTVIAAGSLNVHAPGIGIFNGQLNAPITLLVSPDIEISGSQLSGDTLTVQSDHGQIVIRGNTNNSSQTLVQSILDYTQSVAISAGSIQYLDATQTAPAVTLTATDGDTFSPIDIFLSGAVLRGNTLDVHATNFAARGSTTTGSLVQTSLDFAKSINFSAVGRIEFLDSIVGTAASNPLMTIDAGENVQLENATFHAGDLSIRAALGTEDIFAGIFLTNTHLTGNIVLLDSRGQIGDDQLNGGPGPNIISTIDAQGLGIRARGSASLTATGITVNIGLAPFGLDAGLLQELADAAPQRLPLSAGPNLAISAQSLFLGPVNMQAGDYLFVSSDNPNFLSPLRGPTNLLVNLRPSSPRASFGLEQDPAFRRNVNVVVNQAEPGSLNATFPGTTYVFGGTGYDGVIFAGEAGPVDFGSHDSGVFFMTNSAVVVQSGVNSTGPVGTLAGIEGTPPDSAQNEDELKGKSDEENTGDSGNSDHQVDRVTSPAAAKECT